MTDRKALFDVARARVFAGTLAQSQVDGINRILDYAEARRVPAKQFAYILATATWETGRVMQPVREGGGEAYLRSKRYYPWVGEGLVQVTWETNARKFGATKPGDLLSWEKSLPALFDGMLKGMFTGKKLVDYISVDGTRCDFVGARRVVNGTDRAKEIAAIAQDWLTALIAAQYGVGTAGAPSRPTIPASKPPVAVTPPAPVTPGFWSRVGSSLAGAFFKRAA